MRSSAGPSLSVFHPASETEIKKIVMKSSSCEWDPVPTSLIKECIDTFTPFITTIVKKSLESGLFSDSHVKPLG